MLPYVYGVLSVFSNYSSPQYRTVIMAESVEIGKEKWLLQHYVPTLMCQKCHKFFRGATADFTSHKYKELLTKLENHLLHEHNIKYDSVRVHDIQDDINKEKLPVRRFIREHYSKIREDVARCNLCLRIIICPRLNYSHLHEHLIRAHEDKLTEIQKKDKKIAWYWDYFAIKDEKQRIATCNFTTCTKETIYFTYLIKHLKKYHSIDGPSSDMDDTNRDTDMDAPIDMSQKAKRQEGSEVSSKNMYEMAQGTSKETSKGTNS